MYIFGYGSLINMKENTNELTNPLRKKITPVEVTGLQRSLNVFNKHRLLGVKDVKNKMCNGILFKVTQKELANLIEREKLYTPKLIEPERILFSYKKQIKFKPDDQIICFYPQAKNVLKKKDIDTTTIPVRPKYLTICLEGAAELGEDFLKDFIATT
jgi:hypothetical protein